MPTKRPHTLKLKLLGRFEEHLFAILPLYSPSYSGPNNQVIQYSHRVLEAAGRRVYPATQATSWNLVSPASRDSFDGVKRATVAHTDAIGKIEHPASTLQSIKYNPITDIIYNASMRRPMGGDDKVGVAIALTLAEAFPDIAAFLVADEEVGCVGSGRLNVDPVDFALQFDRKGAIDIVPKIGGTNISSKHTLEMALRLLKHRIPESGGSTDVAELVRRGIAGTAFNMSCGYYNPHSCREYIVYSEAQISMNDAITLMLGLDGDDIQPVKQAEHIPTGSRSLVDSYSSNNYGSGLGYNRHTGGSSASTTPSTVTSPKAATGTTPSTLPVVKDKEPVTSTLVNETTPTPTSTPATTQTTSAATTAKGTATEVEAAKKEGNVILYADNTIVRLISVAEQVQCPLCMQLDRKRSGLVDCKHLVCEDCLMCVHPDEAKELIEVRLEPALVA